MSRIDDLLRQHCPNGVEFRPLGEVGEVFRGRRFTKADYVDDGLGAIHYGELYTHYGTSASEVITRVRSDLAQRLRFVKPGDVVIAEVAKPSRMSAGQSHGSGAKTWRSMTAATASALR